jgi:hypothetical protein
MVIAKVALNPTRCHHLIRHLVGDFGLATSSLAAVDPSDVSHHVPTTDAEMTLGETAASML